MIKLTVIGHLGKDATTNEVNGKGVINFTVAHSEKWKDKSGMPQEKTTWVECSKWGDNLSVAQYLKKGTLVYVDGFPEVRTFNRNDGSGGASLTLKVNDLKLLSSKKEDAPF